MAAAVTKITPAGANAAVLRILFIRGSHRDRLRLRAVGGSARLALTAVSAQPITEPYMRLFEGEEIEIRLDDAPVQSHLAGGVRRLNLWLATDAPATSIENIQESI